MTVQELDSLADVVGEITGIEAGRETVPDTFFDSAEETVIVDMSADDLLARLKAGKVLSPEVKSASAAKFFRKGNLLALREIALRRTADVVEDEVQKYRAEQAIGAVWKTQGNLLCCIGPNPGAEHVVRSAARPREPARCSVDRGLRGDAGAAAPARGGARAHPAGREPRRGARRAHRDPHRE
jgi:two-component system sensor histidine kinase KdpD